MGIPPSKEVPLVMRTSPQHPEETIRQYEGYLQRLARVDSLTFIQEGGRPRLSASAVVDGSEFFVPLEGIIDINLEKARLQREIDRINALLDGIRGKLTNQNFVQRAPGDVVQRERAKQTNLETSLEKLRTSLAHLTAEA
jgi:valyl-tRNA synthetase